MSVVLKKSSTDEHPILIPVSIWTINFILLCLANLLLFMSGQMLFPSLPVYLLRIGGNLSDVGFVMGAYTIGAMIIRPFAGWLVDGFGRKKILIIGMILIMGISLLYQFTATVGLMTLVRILHGLAFGLVSTALSTIAVDILPIARLAEGMGYFGLTSSLSMSLAPLIGFWLVDKYSYTILFLIVSLFSALAFGSSLLVRAVDVSINNSVTTVSQIWTNLLEKTALPASAVIFFLAIVYASVLCFIPLYAIELGIPNIGLFFSAIAVTMIISRPLSGRWTDAGGGNRVIAIGHFIIFIGMVTMGFAHILTSILLAGALIGFGFGFCLPTLQAQSVSNTPVHRRGAATGTFFAFFDLGIGIGSVIWGYVAAAISYQTMYLLNLLPVVLAGFMYYRFSARIYDNKRLKDAEVR
jgi:MFS family permease